MDGLQIRKMPSGGRGEYELVGRQGPINAADFIGREFLFSFPSLEKRTSVQLTNQGGKRRLRLMNLHFPHLARQLATLLLLPRNARDERQVSQALPILLQDRYILDFSFEYIRSDLGSALIKPTRLLARSGDIGVGAPHEEIDVGERISRLARLHERTRSLPGDLDALIASQARFFETDAPVTKQDELVVRRIIEELTATDDEYLSESDPLPRLEYLAGLSSDQVGIPTPVEISQEVPEIKLRSEHIYRARRIRSSASVRFKEQLRRVYNSRCLMCGFRAPGHPGRMLPGVDAAHILPYGNYELDVVQNGMILCKLHHWAFDSHILELRSDGTDYVISLVPDAELLLREDERTLRELESVCGFVPPQFLPKRKSDRPSRIYLDILYERA